MRFQEIQEACWKGYRQAGMKKKGDRQVPNCVPVNEVEIGPEITANQLLYKAAAMAMRDAGREGITLDYDQAIKQASKIYGIPYQPSELPKLLAQRQEIDRQLALLKQGKQVAKQRRQAKRAPTPAGAEEYWKTHALPTDRIKPATKTLEQTETELAEDLKKWFKEKWVRFGPDGKIRGDCARGSSKEGKPKCLPQSKAHALGKSGRASAAAKKRREDPNPERRGAAKNVATKVKENQIPPATGRSPEQLEKELLDRLGRRAGAVPGSNIDQVTNAYQQKILDRMGKRFGLPPGATIAQVQAAQQAYLNKNDPRAAAQYRQNMANIEAGKTAQNKPVQLEPRYPTSMAEDARGDSEQQHGWRAELVDEISPITFEVRLTNRRSRESANFVVRPADLIRLGMAGKLTIDSMDIQDLQTGATRSIVSDDPAPWVYILDAVGALFHDTPALQARLEAQLKAHQDQGLPMLPGLKKREHAGQGIAVKDFVQGQQAAKDALARAQSKKDLDEKQDACYRKVKSRYKVWPSAYASGALVQCRKKGAANWGTGGKKK
jgi:hypothetical protein